MRSRRRRVGGPRAAARSPTSRSSTACRSFSTSAVATPVTAFTTGNIILGGDGSDIIEGRGGDDLIDGDRWLNVRISVRAGHDANGPTGGEIYTADSMTDPTLMHNMLNGVWNPGQLQIVREILTASGPDFDTAFFAGNIGDYDPIDGIGTDVVTVTDTVAARDGIDRLTGIERLQFGDNTTFVLVDGLEQRAAIRRTPVARHADVERSHAAGWPAAHGLRCGPGRCRQRERHESQRRDNGPCCLLLAGQIPGRVSSKTSPCSRRESCPAWKVRRSRRPQTSPVWRCA